MAASSHQLYLGSFRQGKTHLSRFVHEINEDGVRLRFLRSKRNLLLRGEAPLPVKDWDSDGDPKIFLGLTALSPIIQELDDPESEELLVPHGLAASFSDAEASALGLPPSVPFQLRVWGDGNWNDNSNKLNSEFLDLGSSVHLDERIGAFVRLGRITYRIPEPLFQIIELVYHFPDDRDGKLATQAKISEILRSHGFDQNEIKPDEELLNLRIRHVSGFSAAVSGSLDNPNITPVLFSHRVLDSADEQGDLLDEAQQILDPRQNEMFCKEFFSTPGARPTYVLGTGEYVFIDPSIRPTFEAFKKVSISDAKTRSAFLKAPYAVLAEYTESEDSDSTEAVSMPGFFETAQFSDRVIGINEWEAPDLPWLTSEGNEWGVDVLVFEQPGLANPVILPREHLREAIEVLSAAIDVGDQKVTVAGVEIPVSTNLVEVMRGMLPVDAERDSSEKDSKSKADDESKRSRRFVVDTIPGFEALNFVRSRNPPKYPMTFAIPRALMPATKLMSHQEQGVRWLIECFNAGMPGVLNADDMGLGKTLQALVFMALNREQIPARQRQPCLIVAPTGLLNNWLLEIDRHLEPDGLGEVTKAYGSSLKALKTGLSGRDTDQGVPMLNLNKLQSSEFVLTTYESLRDYQISFAQVQFDLVIFDEIQKTKNPRSLLSRASAAINGRFQIGLSGTPVENSLADLWTILDVLAPGLLNLSLRDFMAKYGGSTDDPGTYEHLLGLQRELLEKSEMGPSPVLRRLKSVVFQGSDMPQKIVYPASETCSVMPDVQATAYKSQLELAQKGEIPMIQALQAFKRISLAPAPYEAWLQNGERFIAESGRLKQFFALLDSVHQAREKALIFVESLKLQPILAQVVKERYGLDKLPMIINGSVSGFSRQKFVNEFQSSAEGFDVMLISPKAGGVGITLTAANHVIHLERWWNPAVEDQCNDRAYRIGQKKQVNIYTPVTRYPVDAIPSFDLVLDQILERKRKLAESIFVPSEITASDFSSIFGVGESMDERPRFLPISVSESHRLETGEEFEEYVGACLHSQGFTVSRTRKSWDFGCDLIAKKESAVVLCQVKQVRSDKTLMMGVEEIAESKERYSAQNPSHLALITNALNVSARQQELARQHGVLILNGEHIAEYGSELSRLLSSQ